MTQSPSAPEKRNLTIFGVGPWFVLLSLGYSAVGIGLRLCFPEFFTLMLIPKAWQTGIGAGLLFIGFPFFVLSLRILVKGFPAGKLFTKGTYAACRHPVYAAWVVFIVPALGLLMHSWPLVGVVPAMYITLRLLVRKEEAELSRLFGDEFRQYKRRTPAVFPLLHRFWE